MVLPIRPLPVISSGLGTLWSPGTCRTGPSGRRRPSVGLKTWAIWAIGLVRW